MAHDEQTALGNKGAPFTIEWEGKRFTVSFFTQRVKARIVKASKLHAIAELEDFREALTPEEFQKRKDRIIEDSQNGLYALDSEKTRAFRETPEGKMAVLQAMLGDEAAKLSEEQLIRMTTDCFDQINDLISAATARAAELLREAGYDPEEHERQVKLALGWPPEGTEPTPEQVAELARQTRLYDEGLDPKVRARCLVRAGLLG